MTEYQMFLPLYNGIESLEIGVPEGATFIAENPPKGTKPIFLYGGSIDHGACPSRLGNAYGAILRRRLDHPFVNFGCSANLKLEVAERIASADPAA